MSKANYDLPEEKIQMVMKHSGAKNKREALIIALDSYLRRSKIEELLSSEGQFSFSWNKNKLSKYRA